MRNGSNITDNCFVPQNEPNTVKINFSGVMKQFSEINIKRLF